MLRNVDEAAHARVHVVNSNHWNGAILGRVLFAVGNELVAGLVPSKKPTEADTARDGERWAFR